MDYLVVEIWAFLLLAFVIGFVAGRLLRALSPANGTRGDRAAVAESLATARETEARQLRTDLAALTERLRIAEAESAAAQADVARTGVHLNTTRTDLSRKIVQLEEELATLKKPRVVSSAPSVEPLTLTNVIPGTPAFPSTLANAPTPAAAPVREIAPVPPSPAVAAPTPAPALTSVISAPAPSAAAPSTPPAQLPPDDLKEIVGIGPILEHTLQSLGLKTYAQIATITPEDVAMLIVKVDSSIAERVLRERWVEQARDLYAKKYGRAA
jgi:predicted flap endonuclease-1-like 5' DNA nuclease